MRQAVYEARCLAVTYPGCERIQKLLNWVDESLEGMPPVALETLARKLQKEVGVSDSLADGRRVVIPKVEVVSSESGEIMELIFTSMDSFTKDSTAHIVLDKHKDTIKLPSGAVLEALYDKASGSPILKEVCDDNGNYLRRKLDGSWEADYRRERALYRDRRIVDVPVNASGKITSTVDFGFGFLGKVHETVQENGNLIAQIDYPGDKLESEYFEFDRKYNAINHR